MNRTEIRNEAKGLVQDQLINAIEFGDELVQNINHGQFTPQEVAAIVEEVAKQAEAAIRRMYR